jgi:hypothetical protein
MGVLTEDGFTARVNYAAQCIVRRQTNGRGFDNCFEMWDGDAVVAALVRRARKNPKLYQAIAASFSGTFPASWEDKARRYDHLSRAELTQAARRLQENRGVDPVPVPTMGSDLLQKALGEASSPLGF